MDSIMALNQVGQFIGSIITSIEKAPYETMGQDAITLHFKNGGILRIWDDAQSCCESRYMQIQSDLEFFKNSMFLDAKVTDAISNEMDEFSYNDVQILNIFTSKGVIVVVSHNDHNGYYGGFNLVANYEEPDNG